MKRLLYAFILLFGMFSVHGQSVWIGAENSDWTNPANWSAGVPTAGSVATIPANSNSPVFSGTPIINYTIQLAGMLTFNDFVFNAGNIIIFESGSIVNNAQFINGNGQILDVDGHFENNGTLDNFGMVDVAASGSLDNEAGAILNNNNTTLAFGPVLNAGTFNNNGEINIIVGLDNSGNFNNNGIFESQAGSTVENRSDATMEIFSGSSYSVNGIYNNRGQTRSRGHFIIQIASIFTNDNFLLNRTNGQMEVAGSLINNDRVTLNAPLMINSIGIVENNDQINNNAGIDLEICGNLIQLNTNNIGGNIQNNGSVYEINGTINETNLEFGEMFTDLEGRPAPVPACKADAFLQLPEDGIVNFTGADIEKGRSYASCGAQLVSITASPNSFTSADAGVQIVTITVTDDFGNSASCDDFVTVLPFTPPIVLVDDPDIDFECPEDVTATPEPGAQFAAASFITPEATTTCSPVMATNITLCSDLPDHIPGFRLIGDQGGSRYFVSHDAADWMTAHTNAITYGGELVTIDDAAENAFIVDNISPSSGSIWTGLRRFNFGDSFEWADGTDVDYVNWVDGEPNSPQARVATRIVANTGMWTDRPMDSNHFEYVIEISCFDSEIPGFDFLGSNDGSLYYESHAAEDWTTAANAATAIGGSLVTINNAAENTFIQNAINPSTGSIWTGLANNDNGNNFVWQSGEAVNYTNWNAGEPNETQANVAARLIKSSGNWTDRTVGTHYEFVVEVPAPTMAPTCSPTGSITREVWTNVSGVSVSQIPVNTTPNLTEDITLFETPTDFGNDYGTRISGFIHPPVSGDYRFWIASDDNGELWLSTDNNPANKTRIANVPTYTNSRQWNKFPEQVSVLIPLVAGQHYYIEALQKEAFGGDNLAVRWALPDGTIQEPIPGSVLSGMGDCIVDDELMVTQIAGPQSGGNFPVGETPIIFEVTDACGNLEICEFNVTIEENPADFEITDCPSDITVNTLPGAITSVVTFDEPGGTSTCFRGGPVSVVQNLGLESGEAFPIGNTQITYAVFDSCGNFEGCNFNVNVVEVVAAISLTCPEDLILQATTNNSTVTATWTEPTATTDCFAGGLTQSQVAGPANGSDLAVGTYPVIYVFTDACNNTEICTFNVIVNSCTDADGDGICAAEDCDDNDASLPAAPGTTCDDGDAGTENDVIGADECSCAGTPIPICAVEGGDIAFLNGGTEETICSDDGIANPLDVNLVGPIGSNQQWVITDSESNILGLPMAPPFDLEGVPAGTCLVWNLSFEDGLLGATVGANLGNLDGCYDLSNPVSIVRLTGSDCPNFVVDNDNDGIPADEDCDDNDPSLPTTPGTACDDGNATTENDVIGTDGCSCAGTLIPTCTVAGGEIAFLDGSTAETICADDGVADPLDVNVFGPIGSNQQWVITDSESNILGLPMAPPFDLEGVPAGTCLVWSLSFEDGLLGATVGANLGNLDGCYDLSNSVSIVRLTGADCPNFVVDADGDGVAAAEDCDDNDPSVPTTVGATCDDGNADTENDVIGADGCSCAGTPIETGCNPGFILNSGNITVTGLNGAINTVKILDINNGYNDIVNCFGDCPTPASFDLPAGPYVLSVTLRDANYSVICEYTESFEISGNTCNVGAACDDGDVCTDGDAFDANCNCVGTPATDNDNDGFCAIEDCDDNNASVPAAPGTACNDGDTGTENDVIGADGCSCAGTPIQVIVDNDNDGVPASEDCDDNDPNLPTTVGATCNDGDATTVNDVIGTDGCSCAGTPISTEPDCDNIVITPGTGNITVSGINAPINSIQIFDATWAQVFKCFADCEGPQQIVNGLEEGTYFVKVGLFTGSYQRICEVEDYFTVVGGDACADNGGDADGDGYCADVDCDDNDASLPAPVGSTCNDGDATTENDVIGTDGCSCAGTLIVDNDNDGISASEDCDDNDPNVPTTPGSTCDDGNPDTVGDVYGADGCTCAGIVEGACNPTATPADSTLIISGLSGPNNVIQIFNTANWSTVINCFGDCHNQVVDVDPGNYFVRLRVLNDSYQEVCFIETNVTVTDGSTFSIAPDTEFLQLFAHEENRAVGLNWINNSEYRNDYFVIERSLDGINFTELKTVDAFGYESREATSYEDEDIQPALGEGFYRVLQVFEDGTERYSNVAQVRFDIDLTAVGLFPNPADTEVQLSLVDFAGRSAEIQIYSPLGVLMDAVSLEEVPERAIRFNVANYQAGLYTITVKVDQRKRFSKRFVKITD